MNETEIANQIKSGELPSPQKFGNFYLFDVRISGTGLSFRSKANEYVLRNPEIYLNDAFLQRCNGLPVILEHPDDDVLDSESHKNQIVGSIVLPYIKGNEVWGIARINDEATAQIMTENQLSTSPSVVFTDTDNKTYDLEDGNTLLIEGIPVLIDHLAIVSNGVWDKGSEPSGVKVVKNDSEEGAMPEDEVKADAVQAPVPEPKEEGSGIESMMKALLQKMEGIEAKIAQLESAEVAEVHPDAEPSPELPPVGVTHPDNAEPSPDISELQKRVDSLEAMSAPRADEDESKLAEAQARADSVYYALNDRAPRALRGESLQDYRVRLASKLQSKSDYKGNLKAINDSAAFDMIEAKIYADAMKEANKIVVPDVGMTHTIKTEEDGRKTKHYHAKSARDTWMSPMLFPRTLMGA